MIVPHAYFIWFVTAMAAGISVGWFAVDAVRLRRTLREPPSASRHDRLFGSVIGLVIAAIGIVGVLRYHLGG